MSNHAYRSVSNNSSRDNTDQVEASADINILTYILTLQRAVQYAHVRFLLMTAQPLGVHGYKRRAKAATQSHRSGKLDPPPATRLSSERGSNCSAQKNAPAVDILCLRHALRHKPISQRVRKKAKVQNLINRRLGSMGGHNPGAPSVRGEHDQPNGPEGPRPLPETRSHARTNGA